MQPTRTQERFLQLTVGLTLVHADVGLRGVEGGVERRVLQQDARGAEVREVGCGCGQCHGKEFAEGFGDWMMGVEETGEQDIEV